MSFVVYDLETSGLEPQWNVPLQAALIHTDENLTPLASSRCAAAYRRISCRRPAPC